MEACSVIVLCDGELVGAAPEAVLLGSTRTVVVAVSVPPLDAAHETLNDVSVSNVGDVMFPAIDPAKIKLLVSARKTLQPVVPRLVHERRVVLLTPISAGDAMNETTGCSFVEGDVGDCVVPLPCPPDALGVCC